jgi:hypothetical protein
MHKISITVMMVDRGRVVNSDGHIQVTRSQLRWLLSVNNLIYYDKNAGEFTTYDKVFERHIRWFLTTVGEPLES